MGLHLKQTFAKERILTFFWGDIATRVQTNPIYQLNQEMRNGDLDENKVIQAVGDPDFRSKVQPFYIDDVTQYVRSLPAEKLAEAIRLAYINQQCALLQNDVTRQINCNLTLGWLYGRRGNVELAYNCLREIEGLSEQLGRLPLDIEFRLQLDFAEIQERRGEYTAAKAIYKRLNSMTIPANEEASISLGLGRVYLHQERADIAVAYFEQVQALSEVNEDLMHSSAALSGLGMAYRFLGDLDKAVCCYEKAYDISCQCRDRVGEGRDANHLGSLLVELGEHRKAKRYLKKALRNARDVGDLAGEEERLGNLGILAQARAEKRRNHPRAYNRHLLIAQNRHEQALETARQRQDPINMAAYLTNLGAVLQQAGNLDQAKIYYRIALGLTGKFGLRERRWRILYGWGNLYLKQGEYRKAYEVYKVAIAIVQAQRGQLLQESRRKFGQERADLYDQMVLCCFYMNKLWQALTFTEVSKTQYLVERLTGRQTNEVPTALSIEARLAIIHKSVDALDGETAVVVFNVMKTGTMLFLVFPNEVGEPVGEEQDEWEAVDGRLWVRFLSEFKQDALKRLLVELDAEGEATQGYLGYYYSDMTWWRSRVLESINQQIYQDLLSFADVQLSQVGARKIVFMPNLGLSILPLHAGFYFDGGERHYLLDSYAVSYAPSFHLLYHCQEQLKLRSTMRQTLFAVSNPTEDLPGAALEVKMLKKLFQTRQIVGAKEISRSDPLSIMTEAVDNYVIHFACHGEFDLVNPEKSILQLSQNAPEEQQFTLRAILDEFFFPKTRLVVASACETGLVEPDDLSDEALSLQAGFIHASVPGVVTTLWRVDDTLLATTLLIKQFYELYLCKEEKRTPTQALTEAQSWLRDLTNEMLVELYEDLLRNKLKKGTESYRVVAERFRKLVTQGLDERPFAHPFYWAGFIYTGV